MPENKISDIIRSSLGNIRDTVDANTIIGDPITTANGTTVLPVSKVTVGVATGGVDFKSKKETEQKDSNFGGGGGTGLSVTPVAFLVVRSDGSVELLNVNNPTDGSGDPVNSIVNLIGKAPDLISRVKSAFGKKKDKDDSKDEEEPDEDSSENE